MAQKQNMTRMSMWVFAARGAAQLGALTLLLSAVAILGPAEIGAFVLVSAFAMLLNLVIGSGWSQFVIAWKDDAPIPPTVFWAAIAVGLVSLLVGALGALGLYYWFGAPKYSVIFFVLAAFITLSPLSEVQNGLLVRTNRVGQQSKLIIFSELLGLCVGLAALYAGAGIYALVFNKAVNQSAVAIGGALLTGWRTKPAMDRAVIREIVQFVRHIQLNMLVIYLSANGAELLIGALLGAVEVGIYRTASRISGAVGEILFETTRVLSWSSFRQVREQQSVAAVGAYATGFMGDMFFIVAPIFTGLALVSGNLVQSMLGPVWQGAAIPVALLAMTRLLGAPGLVNEALFGVSGQVRLLPRMMVAQMILSVLLLALLASRGIEWAAFSQALAALLFLPVLLYAQKKYGGVDWGRLAAERLPQTLLAVGVMSLCVWMAGNMAQQRFGEGWAMLAVQIFTGLAAYLGMLFLLRRDLLQAILAQAPISQRFMRAS